MPITNGYVTLAELKAWLTITDTTDDTLLENACTTASRLVDLYCRRRFYAATETHYFTPRDPLSLLTPDLLTVTTLKQDNDGDGVYEEVWTSTDDYLLRPREAASAVPPGPFWEVSVRPSSSRSFAVGVPDNIEIVGSWGYSASTPEPIRDATRIQAARLFRRKDSIFGVAGTGELGQLVMLKGTMDPDATIILDGYRMWGSW